VRSTTPHGCRLSCGCDFALRSESIGCCGALPLLRGAPSASSTEPSFFQSVNASYLGVRWLDTAFFCETWRASPRRKASLAEKSGDNKSPHSQIRLALRKDVERGPAQQGKGNASSSRSIQIAQRNCTTGEAAAVRGSAAHTSSSEDAIYQSEVKRKGVAGACAVRTHHPTCLWKRENRFRVKLNKIVFLFKISIRRGCWGLPLR
jgi:hypothetical protein